MINKLDYKERWSDFISKIPEDIQLQLSNMGLSRNSFWGMRDFCIVYLHKFQKLSSYEIEEKYKDFFINKIGRLLTDRRIREVLHKYGGRTHVEALRLKAKTGRTDYKKRKKAPRHINYDLRDAKHGYKYAVGLEKALKEKKIKKREFARTIAVSDSIISVWTNFRNRVKKEYQEKVCKALNMRNDELFSDIKPRNIPSKNKYYYAPKLRYILITSNMRIRDIEARTGIKKGTLYRFLNRDDRAISKEKLIKLANYFGMNWKDLIGDKLEIDTFPKYFYAVGLDSYLMKNGITKEELAQYLGVDRITVSRWAYLHQRIAPEHRQKITEYLKTTERNIFKPDRKIQGILRLSASQKENYIDVIRVYSETENLAETGRRLNISRERARQILERAKEIGFY